MELSGGETCDSKVKLVSSSSVLLLRCLVCQLSASLSSLSPYRLYQDTASASCLVHAFSVSNHSHMCAPIISGPSVSLQLICPVLMSSYRSSSSISRLEPDLSFSLKTRSTLLQKTALMMSLPSSQAGNSSRLTVIKR